MDAHLWGRVLLLRLRLFGTCVKVICADDSALTVALHARLLAWRAPLAHDECPDCVCIQALHASTCGCLALPQTAGSLPNHGLSDSSFRGLLPPRRACHLELTVRIATCQRDCWLFSVHKLRQLANGVGWLQLVKGPAAHL